MDTPPPYAHLSPDELRSEIEHRQFQLDTFELEPDSRSRVALENEVAALQKELSRKEPIFTRAHNGFMTTVVSPTRSVGSNHNMVSPTKSVASNHSTMTPTRLAVRDQWSRPRTSQSDLTFGNGYASYQGSNQNGFGGHFASDGVVMGGETDRARFPVNMGFGQPEFGKSDWSFAPLNHAQNVERTQPDPHFSSTIHRASVGSNDSNPHSTSSSGHSLTSSPSLPHLPGSSRKRPRDSLNLSHFNTEHNSKSMRTTPSPAPTGTVTPASVDSFELPDDPDFMRLLGGDPKEHIENLRREQVEAERAIKARKAKEEAQMKMDEQIARRLAEEWNQDTSDRPTSMASSNSASGSQPHAYSQSILNQSGGFRRPDPPAPAASHYSPPRLPSSSRNFLPKQEISRPTYGSPSTVPGNRPNDTWRNPSTNLPNYIDLGSDSDDDVVITKSSNPVEARPRGVRPSDRNIISTPNSSSYHNTNGSSREVEQIDLDGELAGGPSRWHIRLPPLTDTMSPYQGSPGSSVYNQNAQAKPGFLQNIANGISNAASQAYGLVESSISNYGAPAVGFSGPSTGGHSLGSYASALAGSSGPPVFADWRMGRANGNPFRTHTMGNHLTTVQQQYLDYLEQARDHTADPRKTAEELKALMDNIQGEETDPRTRLGTPDAFMENANLYEHQKLGLAWLIKMEEGSNKGGILADDMGLGKTIQALALMVSRRSTDPMNKTTLIVAPVALLRQWESEIKNKLKPERQHRLSTYLYHGSGIKTTWEILKKHDVVITTYGTLAAELKRKIRIEHLKKGNPNWKPSAPSDKLPLLGQECKLYRIILDEAQNIKNKGTKAAQAVCSLQAISRFCMTGTPMMNNIGELFSLIQFLDIKPYCKAEKFSLDFSRPFKGSSQTQKEAAMRKLQALLKAILLRRTKKSTVDGQPIITLPERITEIQHATFSTDEMEVYKALESQTQLQFNKYLKAGTVGRNYSNVLVLLLRLRQACCHPHLIKDFGVALGNGTADMLVEDMVKIARGLSLDVVARIKDPGPSDCPICMDAALNATIFNPCGHYTCQECFTRIQDPTHAHEDDSGGGSGKFKCPNCRGVVDPKKVTDWNTFKKVHMPELATEGVDPEAAAEQEGSDASDGSDSETDSDDDSQTSLNGFIVRDDEADDDESNLYDGPKKHKDKGKGKEKKGKNPRVSLSQLKLESKRNAKARRRYLRRLEKEYVTSAKIDKTMEILTAIRDKKEGEKTIIFSQFTSLLDLLEVALNREGYVYNRYDGSMSSNARNDAVISFNERYDCKVMLVSLKAGNAGLNLTVANQVIIMDPFWNPYVESQAIDRAHRIGQRRMVQVHRLLVPETVEDRILALQEKKRELIEGALDEGASQTIGRLGVRELAYLFGVNS